MRRGDVRAALLAVLLDGPGHGYELIQRLETKTDGAWRPSAGSVYPTIQMLDDEGLVTVTDRDGKRVVELTDAGRVEAEERLSADGEPWAGVAGGPGQAGQLRSAVHGLNQAARQVVGSGSVESIERATAIVTQARKDLYLLLAES
ncbi:MAG: PadR family transcriptional regulator [Desertimonas sp.]